MIDRNVLDDLLRARRISARAEVLMTKIFGQADAFEKISGCIDDAICKMVFGNRVTDENIRSYLNVVNITKTIPLQSEELIKIGNREATNNVSRSPVFFTEAQKKKMAKTPGAYRFGRGKEIK